MRRVAPRLPSRGSVRRPWTGARSGARARRPRASIAAGLVKAWTELRSALPAPPLVFAALARPRWPLYVAAGVVCSLAAAAVAFRGEIAALSRHPRLAVASVDVVGARRVAPEEIAALSGIDAGDPWLFVDAARARRALRSHPWVDDAIVERPWLGQVRVTVRECVPVAVLEWGSVRHGLAEDMRILPALVDSSAADLLPRIRGVGASGRRGIDLASFERAFEYVGAIRRERDVAALPVVVTLDRSGRDAIFIESKGVEAILEEPVAPDLAVRNLAAFLETLDSPGLVQGTLHVYSKTTAVWRESKPGSPQRPSRRGGEVG